MVVEEVVTQESEETVVAPTEETQVSEEEKASTEETSPEPTIEDIVAGKKPGEDKTPAWAKKEFYRLREEKREVDRKLQEREREIEALKSIPSGRPILPVENDFVDMEDYRKARTQYEDSLDTWKSNQRQNAEFQEKQKQEREANLVSFNENAKRMREKYPDFDTVVNEPIFTPVMCDEIAASLEYGPEIGYYLAKNPAEALRLSKLTPNKVAKEIGKLEVKFSQAIKRINTNAPPPLVPIKGDDAPGKDTSKMTDDEWYQFDMQRKLKKLNLVK